MVAREMSPKGTWVTSRQVRFWAVMALVTMFLALLVNQVSPELVSLGREWLELGQEQQGHLATERFGRVPRGRWRAATVWDDVQYEHPALLDQPHHCGFILRGQKQFARKATLWIKAGYPVTLTHGEAPCLETASQMEANSIVSLDL